MKKAYRVRVVLILASLVLSLALSTAGCVNVASPAIGNASPAAATAEKTQAAALPTVPPVSQSQGRSIQWPLAMPSDVPVFTYGTITGANNNVLGKVQATFDQVSSDAFSKYQTDLKNAGWKISSAASDQSEIDAKKGGATIVLMFLQSAKNGLKVTLTYNPKG